MTAPSPIDARQRVLARLKIAHRRLGHDRAAELRRIDALLDEWLRLSGR